jgi:purine-nucleoside phosphorylase
VNVAAIQRLQDARDLAIGAKQRIQARALGLEVAGFSCLTNWAAGLNAAPLAHAEVMETGANAAAALADLLEHAIPTA